MKWYRKITSKTEGDWGALGDALEWFEKELEDARSDLKPTGLLWTASQKIPGMMEFRFGQLQELEAILEFIELRQSKVLHKWRKHYSEHYAKALNNSFAEKYAEAEDEVIDLKMLQNEVALMRNAFLGITKGLEALHYQISNLTKLKVACMEDARL